ncbi:MAG: hypothetical protein MHM6MM_006340, partial [Cercozoa sp. M6MM]
MKLLLGISLLGVAAAGGAPPLSGPSGPPLNPPRRRPPTRHPPPAPLVAPQPEIYPAPPFVDEVCCQQRETEEETTPQVVRIPTPELRERVLAAEAQRQKEQLDLLACQEQAKEDWHADSERDAQHAEANFAQLQELANQLDSPRQAEFHQRIQGMVTEVMQRLDKLRERVRWCKVVNTRVLADVVIGRWTLDLQQWLNEAQAAQNALRADLQQALAAQREHAVPELEHVGDYQERAAKEWHTSSDRAAQNAEANFAELHELANQLDPPHQAEFHQRIQDTVTAVMQRQHELRKKVRESAFVNVRGEAESNVREWTQDLQQWLNETQAAENALRADLQRALAAQ